MIKRDILVILPFAFFRSSGSPLSSYYRILALLENNCRIDVLTYPHGEDIPRTGLRIIRRPVLPFFNHYQAGEYKKKLIYDLFLFLEYLSLIIRNRYKYVIAHSSAIYWTILVRALSRARFVANMHGSLDTEVPKWNISKKKKLIRLAARTDIFCNNFYDRIICEHLGVYNRLRVGGIPEDKLVLIPIAVTGRPALNNPVYRKGEKFILLYTGTFVAVQNLELLYRTMVELKNENVELILIGGMKRELEVERIKIEKLGIGSRILLYPRMAQDDLRPYYEQAHLVVSPREFGHDTPMKIFDYLNYGKCILATRRPIHADILDDDNSILAEPDALSFAAAIRNLMNKPGNIAQKGERAKKYFNDNLDFKYMLQKYKDLFDSLESNG